MRKCSAATEAAVGPCASVGENAKRVGIAGEVALVGDPGKFAEECREEAGIGEVGPVDLSDAADGRFCSVGIDLRRSSRRELELGVRLGVGAWAPAIGGAVGWDTDRRDVVDGRF